MAIPGAGWSVIWGPKGDYAYVADPGGNIIWRWFGDDDELSTISLAELQNTEDIINQAGGEGAVPPADNGDGDGVYGVDVIDDPFWPGAAEFFTDAWEAKAAYSEWQEDFYERQQADAEALWEKQQAEQRAYNERLRAEERARQEQLLAESLARQLTAQHGRQAEAWDWAVAGAPGAGAQMLQNLLPGYLPRSVSQSLLGYGQEMGARYDPAWPGGTPLGEAQIVPKGQEWLDWITRQGYPGYLLE